MARMRRVSSNWLLWVVLLAGLYCPVLPAGVLPPSGTELASAGGSARNLSATEAAIVRHIDDHQTEALALLRRVVEINSGTQNLAGVRRVGRIFGDELADLGFRTRWVDGAGFDRAGHLIAERKGLGTGPKVLLIGHLDTVFSLDSPFQRFERLAGNRAKGPGVIDMKGGDVVMLSALRALRDSDVLDRLRLVVVLSGDEEDAGEPTELARRDLIEAGEGAEVALGFEDGDGDPTTAVIARRGSTGWRLETTGNPAHSSQIFQPEVGAGAVFEMSRILDGFYRRLSAVSDLTFSPGLVLGGTDVTLEHSGTRGSAFGKPNVVAGKAIVTGDLRCLSPQQLKSAKRTMQEIVDDHRPGTGATLTFGHGYPPMAATEGNRRLLSLLDHVSRDLGLGPVTAVDPRNAGAADVSFIATKVPMVLDGLGLMGSGGHTVEETAELSTLPTQTAKAALLLCRIAQGAATTAP